MVTVSYKTLLSHFNSWAAAAVGAAVFFIWFAFYYRFSNYFMDVESGLIICRANCRSFIMLADHLLTTGVFGGQDLGGKAALPMYRGFVVFLTTVKLVFGDAWEFGYAISLAAWYVLFCLAVALVIAPVDRRPLGFLVAIVLAAVNVRLLIYSKFVVADFFFAFGVGMIILLTIYGAVRGSLRVRITAVTLAVLWCFVKPQGSFLLAIVVGLLLFDWIGRRIGRPSLRFAGAPLVGVTILLAAVTVSAFGAARLDDVASLPSSLQQLVMMFMEINVLGEDYIATFDDRLGAQILVGHGYRIHAMHDGSWWSLLVAVLHRVPASVSELTFGYTRSCFPYREFCFVYRPILQFLMYGAFVAYVSMAICRRESDPRHLLFVSLFIGYYLAFVGMSLVIIRYLLPFDAMLIVATVGALLYVGEGRIQLSAAGRVNGSVEELAAETSTTRETTDFRRQD